VAEHPVLSGRHQLNVLPEHGPGASARNARTRFSDAHATPASETIHPVLEPHTVEVRDLTVYDQMLEVA
jgi:hypothetical protein